MFENQEERRFREIKEMEMMMEQARFKAAIQKLNEQRSGQSSAGVSGAAGVGGGTLINKVSQDNTENQYVVNGYVENYFE
jgi:putative ribosome biogenesis GTPase RsgA